MILIQILPQFQIIVFLKKNYEKEEEILTKKLNNINKFREIKNSIIFRESVSAEVYGLFNKKGNFVPKIFHKNVDRINRIKKK